MQLASEIIVGAVTGIVSLGLLFIVFRVIFSRLSEKLDISQFNEYVANIRDNWKNMPDGSKVIPIKKKIPKPSYITTRKLWKK